MADRREVWLDGPIDGVPPALQPAAHALIQAKEDIAALAPLLSAEILWRRTGAASAGFHLLHLSGALDRLFTYARGEALSADQKATARAEGEDHPELDGPTLASRVSEAIDRAMHQLRATD